MQQKNDENIVWIMLNHLVCKCGAWTMNALHICVKKIINEIKKHIDTISGWTISLLFVDCFSYISFNTHLFYCLWHITTQDITTQQQVIGDEIGKYTYFDMWMDG